MSNYNNNNNQICTVPYFHNLWNDITEYCSSQINECLVIYGPPCMASSQHIVAIISRATDVHMNALAPRHAKTAWQLCYCLYVNRSIEISNTFAFVFLTMQHSDTRKNPLYWQQCCCVTRLWQGRGPVVCTAYSYHTINMYNCLNVIHYLLSGLPAHNSQTDTVAVQLCALSADVRPSTNHKQTGLQRVNTSFHSFIHYWSVPIGVHSTKHRR